MQNSYNVGEQLPEIKKAPIDRITLALYAGASNDHNPIHLDPEFARSAGAKDVFAHGMLGMAYLGDAVVHWFGLDAVKEFGVRFTSIIQLGDELTSKAEITEKIEEQGGNLLKVVLSVVDQNGDVKLAGDAVIAI